MLIVINPRAGGGKALVRWKRIHRHVREHLGSFTQLVVRDRQVVCGAVARALAAGELQFVAAGGDGTVNLMLDCIVKHASRERIATITLGAIGLGSSNDFHKPPTSSPDIEDVPCRINLEKTVLHDVGLLSYVDGEQRLQQRAWFLNASVGLTAEANRRFNEPNRLLRFLKRASPDLGIGYATLHTLLGHRAQPMTISFAGHEPVRATVKNLAIVKNPHFTGALRYDPPYEPDSGFFHVRLLEDLPFRDLVRALTGLTSGKFPTHERAHS